MLSAALPLATEGAAGVFDASIEPVALDDPDAAIPSLRLRPVGGPLAQLFEDVGDGSIRAAARACAERAARS